MTNRDILRERGRHYLAACAVSMAMWSGIFLMMIVTTSL